MVIKKSTRRRSKRKKIFNRKKISNRTRHSKRSKRNIDSKKLYDGGAAPAIQDDGDNVETILRQISELQRSMLQHRQEYDKLQETISDIQQVLAGYVAAEEAKAEAVRVAQNQDSSSDEGSIFSAGVGVGLISTDNMAEKERRDEEGNFEALYDRGALNALEQTVDFYQPGKIDALAIGADEGCRDKTVLNDGRLLEFQQRGGRVVEAPTQGELTAAQKVGEKIWSIGISEGDFLIPVCHQGMNRSQVMRLALLGVTHQIYHGGGENWVSRALVNHTTLPPLTPLTAKRRIFFAFARAVPNLVDRLLEVEGGPHNTIIVSLQLDDIMNHEPRHTAGKSEDEIRRIMKETHERAYRLYASILHVHNSRTHDYPYYKEYPAKFMDPHEWYCYHLQNPSDTYALDRVSSQALVVFIEDNYESFLHGDHVITFENNEEAKRVYDKMFELVDGAAGHHRLEDNNIRLFIFNNNIEVFMTEEVAKKIFENMKDSRIFDCPPRR